MQDKLEFYKEIYRNIYYIRKFEEKLYFFLKESNLSRYIHLSIGREAVSTGIVKYKNDTDKIITSYRTHGIKLLLEDNYKKVLKEIIDIDGKNSLGSMYVTSKDYGFVHSDTIIGANVSISLGYGLAEKKKNSDSVVFCLFGEGTVLNGKFSESLNIASKLELPILFICENNRKSISTRLEDVSNLNRLSDLGNLYNVYNEEVNGNDVEEVINKIKKTYKYIKDNRKPAFININIPEISGHSAADSIYNSNKHDPLEKFKSKIETLVDIEEIEESVNNSLGDDWNFYIEKNNKKNVSYFENTFTMKEIIEKNIREWLAEDPKLLYIGASIERLNIYEDYKDKMLPLPITESTNLALAYGLYDSGYNIIFDVMNTSFISVCMDILINNFCIHQEMKSEVYKNNIVIKGLIGEGIGMGPQQANNLIETLSTLNNISIVIPSNTEEASGLLKYIRTHTVGIVIYLEHINLRELKGIEGNVLEIGKAIKIKEGNYATVLTYGNLVSKTLGSVENIISNFDVDLELINLVSLKPLDLDMIMKSVSKTKKLIIIEESNYNRGIYKEICSSVNINIEYFIETEVIFVETNDYNQNDKYIENYIYTHLSKII